MKNHHKKYKRTRVETTPQKCKRFIKMVKDDDDVLRNDDDDDNETDKENK
jgi:hypothetical protein